MEAIFKRRSIRKYTNGVVSDEMIKKILEAAMSAPSAGNEQPWHFMVVKSKDTLKALAEATPYAKMVKDAPLVIIVCGDLNLQRHEGYWVLDCSAATENILIEVAALDLGAVWLGIYPEQARVEYIRKQFSLPESILPFAMIPIGCSDQKFIQANRYNEQRVHLERW